VKLSHLIAASLATAALGGHASADPVQRLIALEADYAGAVWGELHDGRIAANRVDACLDAYDQLRAAGGTDDTKYQIHDAAPGNPLTNGTYSAAQLRDYCQKAMSAAVAADHGKEMHEKLANVVDGVLGEERDIVHADLTDDAPNDSLVKGCNEAVDRARSAGLPDDDVIETRDGAWKGTLGAMKHDVCDGLVDALRKRYEDVATPYLAAGMKNDKFHLMIGGARPSLSASGREHDLKKLARANVWFFADSRDGCNVGTIWAIQRVQFDHEQRITKQTDHEYCGDPPASAWR
jgi:hypothetical protein